MLDDFEKEKLIAVLLKDPDSIYKEYHEKLYSEWRHEEAGLGWERQEWSGWDRRGQDRRGGAWQEWSGMAR
jgi:hypothetical protein